MDWQKNSRTKVEKAFFFIFMSSWPEMSFLGTKKRKNLLNKVQKFIFFKKVVIGIKKIRNFTLISKWGKLSL
jgi:hypothetical protein